MTTSDAHGRLNGANIAPTWPGRRRTLDLSVVRCDLALSVAGGRRTACLQRLPGPPGQVRRADRRPNSRTKATDVPFMRLRPGMGTGGVGGPLGGAGSGPSNRPAP